MPKITPNGTARILKDSIKYSWSGMNLDDGKVYTYHKNFKFDIEYLKTLNAYDYKEYLFSILKPYNLDTLLLFQDIADKSYIKLHLK